MVSHPNTLETLQYIPGNIKVAIDVFKIKKQTVIVLYVFCKQTVIVPYVFCKHLNALCNYTRDVSGVADDCRYGLYDSLVWWNSFSGTVQ